MGHTAGRVCVRKDCVRKKRGRALIAVLMSTTAVGATMMTVERAAFAQREQQTNFSVPAGSLNRALTTFGRQAGLQVSFLSGAAAGKTSPGISGRAMNDQALARILAGTGLTYSYTNPVTVQIAQVAQQATEDDSVVTDGTQPLNTINVRGDGGQGAADTPYETPGSVSHVSREELDRIPPLSPGDVFISTPGVINAGNRVGTSINPNIRGLQGMGRVNTTIDGARQTTSSYRGYIGNRDETYVDPDMIGSIDISKGPSTGAGIGGIGGTVAFRTLIPDDIIKGDETWGIRLKGGLGSNTTPPPPYETTLEADRTGLLDGATGSGSLALATRHEHFEGIAAYSKRSQGNYFVGTHIPDGIVFPPGVDLDGDGTVLGPPLGSDLAANTIVAAGGEAFNTSEDTESVLLKGKAKWGNGQSLELGYLLYDSLHGEITELLFAPHYVNEQLSPTRTRIDTYTGKYRWAPVDNDLIDLRANLWLTDIDVDRDTEIVIEDDFRDHQMRTTGGDIGNTALIDTGIGAFTIDTGFEFVHEEATALQSQTFHKITGERRWIDAWQPSGTRIMTGGYANAALDVTEWLSVSGGARYDWYSSKGKGYLAAYPDKSDSRLSPNVGMTLTPIEGVQLFGLYKEGFRPPSLRESHWNFQDIIINNPDLEPEISKNWEFGFNLLRDDVFSYGDGLRFKAVLFDNRYDGYMYRAPVSGTRRPYQWTNLDHANYEGFELSGSYDAGAWFLDGSYNRYFTIEYCPAGLPCYTPKLGSPSSGTALRNDYVTNYIPPKHTGSLTAGVRMFDQALTVGGRVHFASTRFGSSWSDSVGPTGQVGVQFPWPRYTILDIFGSYEFNQNTMLNVSVENLTDEYYFGALSSTGIASPGRTARISLTSRIGGSNPLTDALGAADSSPGDAAEAASWTGLFAGLHAGAGDFDYLSTLDSISENPSRFVEEGADDDTRGNVLRGVQVGYNWQSRNGLVLGFEADYSWSDYDRRTELASAEVGRSLDPQLESTLDTTINGLASLRGKVGYALNDRVMIYGTGGISLMRERLTRTQYKTSEADDDVTVPSFSEALSLSRRGYTLGGGLEVKLSERWSMKAEYSYTALNNRGGSFADARAGVVPSTTELIGGGNAWNPACGDFNDPTTWPSFPPPAYCIITVPPTEKTIPGSYDEVNGRKVTDDLLHLHAVKIGLNFRF